MPSNPTAHLVLLVLLLMATNQRMRSSFEILVALYRIFHTLFSSFFSGSSMVHLWLIASHQPFGSSHLIDSLGASQAHPALPVHPSVLLWGSSGFVAGLRLGRAGDVSGRTVSRRTHRGVAFRGASYRGISYRGVPYRGVPYCGIS